MPPLFTHGLVRLLRIALTDGPLLNISHEAHDPRAGAAVVPHLWSASMGTTEYHYGYIKAPFRVEVHYSTR